MSLSSYINNISDFKAYAKCEKVRPASYRTSLDSGNLFLQVPHDQHKVQLKNCCYRKKITHLGDYFYWQKMTPNEPKI
jgi:hypothetical protein